MAAGADGMCCCPKICKANAAPPDNMPAYKISKVSNLILEKSISSNINTKLKKKMQLLYSEVKL